MKTRILLTIIMVGMIMGAMAQKTTMTLTFTADNNGQYVPLNSILIENLTQGGDTTLYVPDTVLVLDYITDMNENFAFNDNSFSLFQNYPNPMKGKTTICLRLPESENVVVTVRDVMGRELVNQEFQLEKGAHTFSFYPGRESLYFLTARADQQSRTIKMFNSPVASTVMEFCKLEYNGTKTGSGGYKAVIMLNNFVFDLGDQLQYTASSALGDRTIIDTPTGNQTYTFQYSSDGAPCPGVPTVTDIDGNVYNTVLIGSQCWMKENLKTTTYNNYSLIPNITDDTEWPVLFTGAYVWYNNDISWKNKYGALYNWYTIVNPGGLCPTGWHVPTDDEWTALTDYIGGISSPYGNKIKSCRQVNSPLGGGCNTSEHPRWNDDISYGNYGTDDYGFSSLPGGKRESYIPAPFYYIGTQSYYWSSDESGLGSARARYLLYGYGGINVILYGSKRSGYSVRCLRD